MNPSVQDHFAQNNDIIIITILYFYLLLPVVWLIVAKNSTIYS